MIETSQHYDVPQRQTDLLPQTLDAVRPPAAIDFTRTRAELSGDGYDEAASELDEMLPVNGDAAAGDQSVTRNSDQTDVRTGGDDTPTDPPPPPVARGEAGGDDRGRVYDRCMARARQVAFQQMAPLLADPGEQVAAQDMMAQFKAQHGLGGSAENAPDRRLLDNLGYTTSIEDGVGLATNLNALIFIRGGEPREVVSALLDGMASKDRYLADTAHGNLNRMLRAEQRGIQEQLSRREDRNRVHLSTPALDAVIRRPQGDTDPIEMRPTEIIDAYAADLVQAWAKKMEYLGDMAAAAPPAQSEDFQSQINTVAAELAQPLAFNDEAILAHSETALRASDPDVRAQVAETFVQAVKRIDFGRGLQPTDAASLMRTALTILEDPALATPDNMAFCNTIAVRVTNWYPLAAEHAAFMAERLRWEGAQWERVGYSPSSVAAVVEGHAAGIVRNWQLEQNREDDEQQMHTALDEALGSIARRYASRGDFTGAGILSLRIRDEYNRHTAMLDCLDATRTQQDVDDLHGIHGVTAAYGDPIEAAAVNLLYDFTQARLGGDTAALVDVVRLCAPALHNAELPRVLTDVLQSAYSVITQQNPEQAIEVARQLVATVRNQPGVTYETIRPFSEALIEAGDRFEPAAALADIERDAPQLSPREQEHSYRRLAGILRHMR